MKKIELSSDQALVLQQVMETGQEDIDSLAENLMLDRRRLSHILQNLKHRGLIIVNRYSDYGMWIRLSSKGTKLTRRIWSRTSALVG